MYPSTQIEYQKPCLFELLPGPKKLLLGFHRHTLLELHQAGLIRIIKAHCPGRKYPIEVVHIPSLLAYLQREEELANAQRLEAIRTTYPTATQEATAK